MINPDPIADAVRMANEELHISVERDGNVIRLNDPIPGDPRRTLLTLIALCNEADVAVATPSWSSNPALAAWRKPELIIATRSAGGVHGALYELRGFGPGTYKDDIQGLPRPRETWSRSDGVPARSLMLLHALGVTPP